MHKMKVKFYEKLHNNNRRSHTVPPIFYFIICNPLSVPNKIFKSLLQNVQIYRNSLMKPQKKSAKPHTPPILKFISRPTYSPPVLGGVVEDRGGKSVICYLLSILYQRTTFSTSSPTTTTYTPRGNDNCASRPV